MEFSSIVKRSLSSLVDWLRPPTPGELPATLAVAQAMASRERFALLLPYRDTDPSRDIVFLNEGDEPAAGFMLNFSPLLVAGVDAEAQLEAVINSCPPNTVLQFGVLSTPQVQAFVDTWVKARLEHCENEVIRQTTLRRRDFMLQTAVGPSMLPMSRLHPRLIEYYLSVRVPYEGALDNREEMGMFLRSVTELRNTIKGALAAGQIGSTELASDDIRFVLRELLNPQISPRARSEGVNMQVPMWQDLVDRNAHIRIAREGHLLFSSGPATPEVAVSCVTTDAMPASLYLPMMSLVLGAPDAWDERISCPFWAYTTIHVLDPDKSRDALTAKFGLLNKQTMSDSAWYRSMMGHMYERREHTNSLLSSVRQGGHKLVRAYSGINLYTHPQTVRQELETAKGLWRNAGFRVSEEKFITLPVFLASLPLAYSPAMDPPNRGLQRAQLMSSLNGACLALVQGDWQGTPLVETKEGATHHKGGLLLTSRRGQLASFDLLHTSTNYNFVIVAASGSGKSFLANEIILDFLSKGGIARIIDVGRSYYRFCQVVGGTNLVFSPSNPVSLNPFSGVKTEQDLDEMLPMMKAMLRQMAFPLTDEKDTDPWQYAMLDEAIKRAWTRYKDQADLSKVHEYLHNHRDARARDLAFQIQPYAIGRYAPWFNGPRNVDFSSPLVVIELEELKQDAELQAVVLTLIIHHTTKEMYLTDRRRPKLLAIDEAWDLLGGVKTGAFIETAFRRARKYNGIAGVITQSFEDFEKSAAAKATIQNAAWQFILHQKPESLDFAVANKMISGGEGVAELLKTVASGPGFSEVCVRSEHGSGIYRFVTDRHSYYTFTTKPADINRLDDLVRQGKSLTEAIDILARQDYAKMWGDYYRPEGLAA